MLSRFPYSGRGRGDHRGSRGSSSYRAGSGRGRGGDDRGHFNPAARGGIFQDQYSRSPDHLVRNVENMVVSLPCKVESTQMPRRPGYGIGGQSFELYSNFFRIDTRVEKDNRDVQIFQYSVATMQELNRHQKRRLMQLLFRNERFKEMHVATDYAGIILTTRPIPLDADNSWTDQVDNREKDSTRPELVSFKVELSRIVSFGPAIQYVKDTTGSVGFGEMGDVLQVINILLGYFSTLNRADVYQIGPRNKLYLDSHGVNHAHEIGRGLRAIKGFIASARVGSGRLLLNLNVVTGAFFTPVRLSDLIERVFANMRHPGAADLARLESILRATRVQTSHIRARDGDGNPIRDSAGIHQSIKRVKTIAGFSRHTRPAPNSSRPWDTTQTLKFDVQDAQTGQMTKVTVYDYFRQHYPEAELDAAQKLPVCNLGTLKKPVWVPSELCMVLPGQPFHRVLDPEQTSEMIKHAAMPPNVSLGNVTDAGVKMFGIQDQEAQRNTLAAFGFRVQSHPLKVTARILPPPRLVYGRDLLDPRDASWNLSRQTFCAPASFRSFLLTDLGELTQRSTVSALQVTRPASRMTDIFTNELRKYGLKFQTTPKYALVGLPAGGDGARPQIERLLDDHFKRMAAEKVQITLVILPRMERWLYSRIKYLGDVKYGVHTVCTYHRKLERPDGATNFQHIGNMALKFNIKGGGVSHRLHKPTESLAPADQNTMFLGIDVTHPSPGSNDAAPSIAAVVANIDWNLSQWPASIRIQRGRQEMVEELCAMVVERLRRWLESNKTLPTKIIVYRDGVSEGQYQIILELEIPAIRKAIATVYTISHLPKLAVIVVGKRHHVRFYPSAPEHATRNFNCRPGTIVDRGVTDSHVYDFYLQAHAGLQGTARPAHYMVVLDELALQVDQLQTMTHNLCYTFSRATKAISICPLAYYADRACEHARHYMFDTLQDPFQYTSDATDDGGKSEWSGMLHPNIAGSTFYI